MVVIFAANQYPKADHHHMGNYAMSTEEEQKSRAKLIETNQTKHKPQVNNHDNI